MKKDICSIQHEGSVEQIIAAQRGQETTTKVSNSIQLTPGRLLRLNQFIPDIIPMCKSAWWEGVRKQVYPSPIRLGPKITAWRSDDLIALIEKGV